MKGEDVKAEQHHKSVHERAPRASMDARAYVSEKSTKLPPSLETAPYVPSVIY